MKIHLIGIGGIGVSALAQYYLSKGHKVSGSDLTASEITELVKSKGGKIFIGNFAKNITQDLDLVVYSPAVKKDNPELLKAKSYKLKTISYPEAVGELTKEFYTIAVAGAHGKSTTTAMIALVLAKAGLDPTVIVGTKLKEFKNSNFRAGKSKLMVVEACEYDNSFMSYRPKIIVTTNIDKEHLDYFKTFSNVKKAFKDFVLQLPENGFWVLNKDDKGVLNVKKQITGVKFKMQEYGMEQPETIKIRKLLKVPGEHNVSNALAVLQVSRILAIPDSIFYQAISEFSGTWRRFEVKNAELRGFQRGKTRKITIVSDYAHHPNEISATLKAAREKYPDKELWCVFQPHQHQRTFYLFDDFVKMFRTAPVDKIILTDIYDVAGRETKTINKKISSQKLVEKINKQNIVYMEREKLKNYLEKNIEQNQVLIIMGAGDIYELAKELEE